MNEYSSDWFDTFLKTIDPAQTQREVEFLERQSPVVQFPRVLDLCCGLGRHSGPLAAAGYRVTGIERDSNLASIAYGINPGPTYLTGDVTEIEYMDEEFDAVICMWQSFGFGSAAENDRLLESIFWLLRPGGRLMLDIYNRKFFETRQGVLESTRSGRAIKETKSIEGDRIRIELIYDNNQQTVDRFDWEIFTVEQIEQRAAAHGFTLLTACSGFDELAAISEAVPRMQLVLERSLR